MWYSQICIRANLIKLQIDFVSCYIFAFTFIYFEDFQNLTKIYYFSHSLYKILKGSRISQWSISPNIILIMKLPSNIWVIITLYPPIVQIVWMFVYTKNDTSWVKFLRKMENIQTFRRIWKQNWLTSKPCILNEWFKLYFH